MSEQADPPEAGIIGGTQAIARAARILRAIARRGMDGARLTELTRTSGLPHPTIRRILKCLMEERLVAQDPTTRRYRLGPLNFELGLATLREEHGERAHHDMLVKLARLSGDTVYLMARSGADIVCLDRAEGSFPIRVHLFSPGGRRPLGFGAAGLALLSGLDDLSIERVLSINAHEVAMHKRLTVDKIWEGVRRTRERGYATTTDIYTMGIGSIGVAIPNGAAPPIYAINVSTVGPDRFNATRITELYRLMSSEIAALETPQALLSNELEWEFT